MEFTVYFNKKRQWFKVVLHDVSPNTFQRRGGGRWGYYLGNSERSDTAGLFGEIHLVRNRVRVDTVVHELTHLFIDIILTKYGNVSVYNEEKLAILFDELVRNFYKEYYKTLGIDKSSDMMYNISKEWLL